MSGNLRCKKFLCCPCHTIIPSLGLHKQHSWSFIAIMDNAVKLVLENSSSKEDWTVNRYAIMLSSRSKLDGLILMWTASCRKAKLHRIIYLINRRTVAYILLRISENVLWCKANSLKLSKEAAPPFPLWITLFYGRQDATPLVSVLPTQSMYSRLHTLCITGVLSTGHQTISVMWRCLGSSARTNNNNMVGLRTADCAVLQSSACVSWEVRSW